MKYHLFIFLSIALFSRSFQLLKRTEKAESKTEFRNNKENLDLKTSMTNLNANEINKNEEKSVIPPKGKVSIISVLKK